MLLTIEKVLILKKVSIFDQVTDEVLAGLAQRLEELELTENTPVFAKGEPGDSLYMIVDGQVRIHDGDRELQMIGEGDIFGEMALLDPELRSASATTTRPTRLLRLAPAPFFELLDEEPEVAVGIIRVLTRRLRERLRDISELDARLKALPSVQPA